MNKPNLAVVFGGQSSEHDISCLSAPNVIDHIDKEKYNLYLIGITKEGHWVLVDQVEDIRDGSWRNSQISAVLSPDATKKGMYLITEDKTAFQPLDVVFPVLHGLWGEDGTIQGILEMAKIPYVGCGVLASAVSMDKFVTKELVSRLGIRQAAFVPVLREQLEKDEEAILARVEKELGYPVFVKPSRAGSSCGVNKAVDRASLRFALAEAAKHDRKILVEEMIVGREIECAVLGGYEAKASGVGEILSAADFYDFDAKYNNADSRTIVDPDLPKEVVERVRESAVRIFAGVDGYGLSRVDFFVKADGEVVFNEINTLPGFTAISMYPMLWEQRGVSKDELVEELIRLAFARP